MQKPTTVNAADLFKGATFTLDGLKRCPKCINLLPDITFETDMTVTFECKKHGAMATGTNLEIAVSNWNHFVQGAC